MSGSGEAQLLAIINLPESVLEVLPALEPPPGVIPNFENPYTIQPQIIGLSSAAIAISTILFAIRVYNKIFVSRSLRWDDLTCTIGYLLIIVEYVGIMYATVGGPLGIHQYDLHAADALKPGFLIGSTWLNVVFVQPMLLFVKTTFFLMYLDIFSPFQWMKFACIIGGTVTVLFYTAVTIVQFYFATPGPGESFKVHAVTDKEYSSNILSVPAAAVGLVFDIYLLILPLIAVSQLKMPLRRKIGTSLLFGTGVLAIIMSILSIYYRMRITPDSTWTGAFPEIVTVFEGCFGLMCVCMPSVAKVSQKHKLVSRTNNLFSSVSRLLRSSRGGTSYIVETESDTIALSQKPKQRIHVTFNSTSTVGDVEAQSGKDYNYSMHAITTEPMQTVIAAGRQPVAHKYN